VVQTETPIPNSELVVAPIIEPVSASNPNQKPSIPYSLILMPKYGPTIKTLLTNKDKLSELARTSLNEHCSTILLSCQKNWGTPAKELCQPTLNGWGGPIAPIAIQATNFRLKNDMIQQVQNSCQLHGLPGDDANKHLDKFLHVTQSIKVNGVINDALHLHLFPHSLMHYATAWFDCLPRNSIITFEKMDKMFLGKYFPPSMVTKLRNEITNFRQCPTESLFKAWEHYKLSIDLCPNHNMLPASLGILPFKGVSHSITSSFDPEIVALKAQMAVKLMVVQILIMIVQPPLAKLKTYMLRQPIIKVGNNQGRYQFFQRASHGQNPPPAYQPPAYQASCYQAPVQQALIPQPQVVTTSEFINYMKANDAILKNMQTNMTSLTNSNLELKNMFGQFMKMNTTSSSSSGMLPSNKINNPKEDLKGITNRSRIAYKGSMIPTTSSHLKLVESKTEVTKDTVPPTNNESTKDVQPPVVHVETQIPNFEPVVNLVSALKPNPKPSIPYPSRLHDQKLCDKTNDQKEKFFQIFQDLNFNISFADALILMPKVAEDVFVKVGTFHFRVDFVVVDFDADPRVTLILERSFLKTGRALIDVYEGELTLRVGNKAITFNLDQTSRYFANYDSMMSQFHQKLMILSIFGGDIPLLEEFLNDDPSSPPLPPQELKVIEPKNKKSSIDEPPVVELKDLLPHLEYEFLEGDDKLPIIIAKDLKDEEKTALIKVLK
nr:reverse transcriptase domain-containing protein [Tanacetum cinerariifolium]